MATFREKTLTDLRRDLHAHPERGWEEFRTTALIAEELDGLGFDISLGGDALERQSRFGTPSAQQIEAALARARDEGAPESYLDAMDGVTGVVATQTFGDGTGPHVGVRVDIDALEITEAVEDDHRPASDGFVSQHTGVMHACGHDGHTAIGIGIARELDATGDFAGTVSLFFQPAEEGGRGGKAMSETRHIESLDYLYGLHLGLGVPTGTVIASYERPLASAKFDVTFTGSSAHAGKAPQAGRNALQAAAAAIQNLYGLPRHSDGITRVNVGEVRSPNPQNSIAETVTMRLEVRGEDAAICDYLIEHAREVIDGAAAMHGVDASLDLCGQTTTFTGDTAAWAPVVEAARSVPGVEDVVECRPFGASEDASFLIRAVQEAGGAATYLGIGATTPSGHHTPRFDFDERALDIGVAVVTDAIQQLGN